MMETKKIKKKKRDKKIKEVKNNGLISGLPSLLILDDFAL